jgi:hypothetical protein
MKFGIDARCKLGRSKIDKLDSYVDNRFLSLKDRIDLMKPLENAK